MTETLPMPKRIVVDVRHLSNDEALVCSGPHPIAKWAMFAVRAEMRQFGMVGASELFLCRPCISEFLTLADGIGVS